MGDLAYHIIREHRAAAILLSALVIGAFIALLRLRSGQQARAVTAARESYEKDLGYRYIGAAQAMLTARLVASKAWNAWFDSMDPSRPPQEDLLQAHMEAKTALDASILTMRKFVAGLGDDDIVILASFIRSEASFIRQLTGCDMESFPIVPPERYRARVTVQRLESFLAWERDAADDASEDEIFANLLRLKDFITAELLSAEPVVQKHAIESV